MTDHILITGANRGIGAAIARALAPHSRLTLLCRDRTAGETFLHSLPPGQEVRLLQADLSTLNGIRAAANSIRQLPPIQGLIHNAAIWPQEKRINPDGLEEAFVTNHLAPFLLNLSLEDLWKAHATRIVQITAGLYPIGDRDFAATAVGANFSALKTYASTKLLNLATTMTFAQRWQGTPATINAVHPGVVRTDLGAIRGFKGALLRTVKKLWLTPAKGAEASVFVLTQSKGTSGLFYNRFQPQPLAPFMQDPEFLAAVWQHALQWARIGK